MGMLDISYVAMRKIHVEHYSLNTLAEMFASSKYMVISC